MSDLGIWVICLREEPEMSSVAAHVIFCSYGAAEALGLSRRTIAYYSNGERKIPKAILLACTGWEARQNLAKAA